MGVTKVLINSLNRKYHSNTYLAELDRRYLCEHRHAHIDICYYTLYQVIKTYIVYRKGIRGTP